MLLAFDVENYRSFQTETRIELRPITLLLGRNSSGKSSLTRFIPLLQQSLDRRTASPILWNSDIIDFGDIENVRSHGSQSSEPVRIGFEISAAGFHNHLISTSPFVHSVPSDLGLTGSFHFAAFLTERDKRTNYQRIELAYEGSKITLHLSDRAISRVTLNGKTVADYPIQADTFADTSKLFPGIFFRRPIERGDRREGAPPAFRFDPVFIYTGLTSAHDYFINKKTSAAKKAYNRERLIFVPRSKIDQYAKTLDNTVGSKLGNRERLDTLADALFVQFLIPILSYCESQIRPALENGSYLGPARASGSRFYRYQELSVERIDSRGENLPMYLSSLGDLQMRSFNQVLEVACGYKVRVVRSSGHASIEVALSESNTFENLADVGFGFSQLLPIVAQIHAAQARPVVLGQPRIGRSPSPIIAIEQPELHLHPAFQSGLGDLFVAASQSLTRTLSPRFLIETHSEALVARLGELVASNALSKEKVILYFVDKPSGRDDSIIKIGGYDANGNIENWPTGFFSAPL